MSDSLWPHESQHARPPCPSPTPGVYSNSCPSSWWCRPAISSSVVPFSSSSQCLPASGSSPTSQLFAWSGQSVGVSASASVLPMNTQDWSFKYVFVLPSWISLSRMNYIPLDVCSEKAMAPHSSTLAWKIPWTEEPGELLSMGSLKSRTRVSNFPFFTFLHWRRKWQPAPVFLSGEPQGWRSLVGFLPMGSHRVGHDWSDLAAAADVCWQYVTTIRHFRTWPTSKWMLTY